MKFFIFISIIFISLNAKVIDAKQLFNKRIIEVKELTIRDKKSFYGITKIDESLLYDITLRYDGFVNRLFANTLYHRVKKSEKLFNIYSQEVANIQEEMILAKELNPTLFKSLKKRLKLLDIDSRVINKMSNSPIYNFDIYSPFSGVIIKKDINSGSYVKKGKSIFQIADLSRLWVIAKVYQKDISFVNIGMLAKIDIEGFKEIESKVDFIYPTLDKKSKTIDVRLLIDNKDSKIYPNFFTKIDFFGTKKRVLMLPKSAVLTKGDKHYIFRPVNDREFEPIEIKAERFDSRRFEIISGLSSGDRVIDGAMFLLDSDALSNGLYEDEDW